MPGKLIFALAQLNPTVGDISGNLSKLRSVRERAAGKDADLVVTTELFLSGYPAEDLVLKPSFQNSLRKAVDELAADTADGGPAVLVGVPWYEDGKLYNAALLLDGGKIAGKVFKYDLPNYGPFDEKRIFCAAPLQKPLLFRGVRLGVMICEDMWTPPCAGHLKSLGAEILVVPNGSPFEIGKTGTRRNLAAKRVKETCLPLIYLNQICGQDELVFDGSSFVLDAAANPVATLPSWAEDVGTLTFDNGVVLSDARSLLPPLDTNADIYHALMTGLRDYVNKNGFPGIVLGLSGGIDSSLSAALAVDALGPDRVWGVMLPSPYTSTDSIEDATALAHALGCKLDSIPITDAMKVFDAVLDPTLGDKKRGVTQENIQARCRGLLLMALSNATGNMVLSTGNKSEMSVGYSTLYGDMCGGFSVLKDVYKTDVYNVSRWRNAHKPASALGPDGPVIPERALTKAPTAELRPNQKDEDSLPPYSVLDGILERLIERDMGLGDIEKDGFDRAVAARVWTMLDNAEYKRRQSPPGVKITRRSLSRDRRYPITNKYREA
ncbi:MAG: NAD+ synthase [Alphaproteobacteria bacterium]|nr:NAD+ synthase [Alphaproteobacteria bacterium]